MNPYVKRVRPLDDYQLEVEFENGEHRLFDMKPYLHRGVFARLQNRAAFQAARVVAARSSGPARWI
jgi:hypothetical protein